MSFFHYIINQKRNNFIKHCPPPCTKKPLKSKMCIYIKSSLCKWGLCTRGGGGGTYVVSRAFMAGVASQAGDADSSRAPGLTSGVQGSMNVHRGALLLVPQ